MHRLLLGLSTGLLLCAGCSGGAGGTNTPSVANPLAVQNTPVPIPTVTFPATAAGSWRSASFRGARSTLPYQLFIPAIGRKQKVPLVLFLHGADCAGVDNGLQLAVGQSRSFVTLESQARFPCFFVAPQAPEGVAGGNGTWSGLSWFDATSTQRAVPTAPMQLSLDLVRALKRKFPAIDADRVYIVGFSMGGFGVWDAITRQPNTFAAAIPICGGGDPHTAARVAALPLWAWHDVGDPLVNINRSRQMITAIRRAGGKPRFSQTTGFGHGSWVAAFQNPDLIPWLFAQKRSSSSSEGAS